MDDPTPLRHSQTRSRWKDLILFLGIHHQGFHLPCLHLHQTRYGHFGTQIAVLNPHFGYVASILTGSWISLTKSGSWMDLCNALGARIHVAQKIRLSRIPWVQGWVDGGENLQPLLLPSIDLAFPVDSKKKSRSG